MSPDAAPDVCNGRLSPCEYLAVQNLVVMSNIAVASAQPLVMSAANTFRSGLRERRRSTRNFCRCDQVGPTLRNEPGLVNLRRDRVGALSFSERVGDKIVNPLGGLGWQGGDEPNLIRLHLPKDAINRGRLDFPLYPSADLSREAAPSLAVRRCDLGQHPVRIRFSPGRQRGGVGLKVALDRLLPGLR